MRLCDKIQNEQKVNSKHIDSVSAIKSDELMKF